VTGSGIPAGSEGPVLKRITTAAGLITAAIGVIGLIGLASGITAFTSVLPGYKSIAVSAALIWIFLGLVLALYATRPHRGKLVLAVRVVLAGIVIIEAIELALSLMGSHSVIEILSVRVGSALLGNPTTPISPAASALIIPSATVLLLLLLSPGINKKRNQQIRDAGGIAGLAIALVAFTFVLSYVYGAPFLYNTALVPMALTSALAGLFTGVGLVAAAGKAAIPLKYFTGSSTRARLLRVFVPLVIILTLVQDILFVLIADVFRVQDALILSVCIVIFGFVTAWVIARFSGRIGRDLERAEDALVQKNEDLGAMNEELTAITEELRQSNDELIRNEKDLMKSQQRNTFLADILDKSAQSFVVGYPDGKLGIVNKAFEDLTGYSADELRGMDWGGVLTPPEWQEAERQRLAELHRTGNPVWYEKEYIRKDGTRVPIELLVHLVANEDGSPLYYYSFITDITERRQAEKSLHEAQLRTATILEGIADTFYSVDEQWRFTMVNPAAEKAPFGRPAVELLGRVIWELYPGLVGTRIHRHYIDAAEKHAMEHFLSQSLLNGRWYDVFMQGWRGGVDVYMRDITERKRAEEALRENEQRWNLSLEVSNMGTWDLDLVRHTAYRSLRYDQIFGYAELLPEWTYEMFLDHVIPEDREEVDRKFQDAIEKKEDWNFECRILRKDGIMRWILARGRGEYDEGGKLVRMIGIAQDITERKRAEEELLRRNEDLIAANEEIMATQEELQQSNDELIESEQELRKTSQYLDNLINYANAPIVVWDPTYMITRFNHAFEELTGRTAREIIGQRLEVLFPERYLDASMEIIRKTTNGERLKIVEIPILNRKSEIRIVLWNSATLFEADGSTIQSTIAQGNDITERKMTEAELEERNEELNSAIEELTRQGYELNEALREKEVLLSEVHHRVKNNLTAFISLLSLESTYDDSPAGLALKKDLQNRARSMALIHETLYRTKKYSRVDMDVYLSTLVGQIVSSYESAKSVETVVDAHGITLDLSRATPGGLIVNELLTNSLKYAFPMSFDCQMIRGMPCMIEVSLTEDDGAYFLTVRDNGTGLPEDLDITTTKTLGLKLVNFLAKHQLRASIEVHSDRGADFRFRFRDKK